MLMNNNGKMTMGLIGSFTKENEKRVAIHPKHFHLIDAETRSRLYVEKEYGKRFGISDNQIAGDVAKLISREEIFETCDIVMLFKPTAADLPFFRQGQVIWGALHLVQGPALTQTMIDKKLTGIAMESMFIWKNEQERGEWIFHTQSEFAGYCSVMQALFLRGMKGWHDQQKKVAVIGFGNTGRGAIHACLGLDFTNITVYTQRSPELIRGTIPHIKYSQYRRVPNEPDNIVLVKSESGTQSLLDDLIQYDIIVNCILQDISHPITYIYNQDLVHFKPQTLLIDVSCDLGIGFEFSQPTSFSDPLRVLDNDIWYYAVDHSPSILYQTASFEHSKVAWPHVKDVMAGEAGWDRNLTVGKAIEIKNGTIINPKILEFQNRKQQYPHLVY